MRMAEKRAFQDLSVEAARIGSIIMVTEERQKREKGVTPIPAERVEEWLHCNSTNFCSTNKVIT